MTGTIPLQVQDGIVRKQVILLDEEAVDLQVEAYVPLSLASYNPGDIARFHERMCGLEDLLGHGDVTNVRSSVVLERIKRTTALPLP